MLQVTGLVLANQSALFHLNIVYDINPRFGTEVEKIFSPKREKKIRPKAMQLSNR